VRVRILGAAELDLRDGCAFYEVQRETLGDYFLDSLYADIDSLALYAGIHRSVYGSHRLLARVFPYAVYYDIFDEDVLVWAVLDCRRSPRWTAGRLRAGRKRR